MLYSYLCDKYVWLAILFLILTWIFAWNHILYIPRNTVRRLFFNNLFGFMIKDEFCSKCSARWQPNIELKSFWCAARVCVVRLGLSSEGGGSGFLRCTSSLSYVFFNLPLISYPIPFPRVNGRIPPAKIRRARKILRDGRGMEKNLL